MSKKDARKFQSDMRKSLAKRLEDDYRKRLSAITEELTRQRSECSQEATQIQQQLDRAIEAERVAIGAAKHDKTKARERETAARERLRLDLANKKAKTTQKKRTCEVEAEAIKARAEAEKAHHAELKRIEGWTKTRDKPLSTSKERLREQQDEVEQNLPAEYVPLWHQVRRTFHVPKRAEGLKSLTEAFMEYAEENPDLVLGAQEQAAEAGLSRDIRRKNLEDKKAARRKLDAELAAEGITF